MNDFHYDRQHARPNKSRFSKLERLGLRGAAMIYLDCQPVQAAILVALLVRDGPMDVEELSAEIYVGRPPASNAMRVHISRLRAFLQERGAEAEITKVAAGYELSKRPALLASLLSAAEMMP